ncbi:MAG: hypothetical protein QOI41_1291, partial [Myxococcales bacterium]|nr:hypothetical protein [Myxococcales bacterium]
LVLPAIGLAVAAGMYGLRVATHATSASNAADAGSTMACTVASSRTIPVGPDDRLAILPDGTVVIARDIHKGLKLENLSDGGTTLAPGNPMIAAIGHNYDDVVLRGVTYEGAPATFVQLDQEALGTFIGVFSPDATVSQRVPGPVNGIAAATFGKGVVMVSTTPEGGHARPWGMTSGAEAFLLARAAGIHRTSIEEGGAAAPSVAVQGDRVAVAYRFGTEIHFARLDEGLARIGDVQTVAQTTSAPAVAFAPGNVPAVFWVDDAGGKTRLYGSALVPGSTGTSAFSPPKIATAEPLSPRAPVTAQLPDGAWVVAWMASTGGLSTLRVSPIGEAGELTSKADLASSSTIDALRAVSTSKGVDFWWYESESLVRMAEVTCPVRR